MKFTESLAILLYSLINYLYNERFSHGLRYYMLLDCSLESFLLVSWVINALLNCFALMPQCTGLGQFAKVKGVV